MRLLFCFLLVSGCAPAPFSEFNPHSGVQTHSSSLYQKMVSTEARVAAHGYVVEKGSMQIWGLRTYVIRRDLNYPKITKAWSNGRKINYSKIDRHRIGTDRAELGAIIMTRHRVEALAETGFSFELSGPRGNYEFSIPKSLFRELLNQVERH